MDRNPARTATLTDSADWAWQFSQTPDSRACSPAALASSWVYWVICEPPGMNTSSLESRNLTAVEAHRGLLADERAARVRALPLRLDVAVRADRVVVPLHAGRRIRGPGTAPALILSRRMTSVGIGSSEPAE